MTDEGRGRLRRRDVLAVGAGVIGIGTAGCSGANDDGSAETASTTGRPVTAAETAGRSATNAATTSGARRTPTAHAGYDTTEVRVRTPTGEILGTVTAAIADTPELRYRGLSDTESLPENRGMLFVFAEPGRRTFVMRGMDFGIDIVFAGPSGEITRIHHAPAPRPDEDGNDHEYPGVGQYVLEVTLGWTTDRGVGTGDVIEFEL